MSYAKYFNETVTPDEEEWIIRSLFDYLLGAAEEGRMPDINVFWDAAADMIHDRNAAIRGEKPSRFFPELNFAFQ